MENTIDPDRLESLAKELAQLSREMEEQQRILDNKVNSALNSASGYNEAYVRSAVSRTRDTQTKVHNQARAISTELSSKSRSVRNAAQEYRRSEDRIMRVLDRPTLEMGSSFDINTLGAGNAMSWQPDPWGTGQIKGRIPIPQVSQQNTTSVYDQLRGLIDQGAKAITAFQFDSPYSEFKKKLTENESVLIPKSFKDTLDTFINQVDKEITTQFTAFTKKTSQPLENLMGMKGENGGTLWAAPLYSAGDFIKNFALGLGSLGFMGYKEGKSRLTFDTGDDDIIEKQILQMLTSLTSAMAKTAIDYIDPAIKDPDKQTAQLTSITMPQNQVLNYILLKYIKYNAKNEYESLQKNGYSYEYAMTKAGTTALLDILTILLPVGKAGKAGALNKASPATEALVATSLRTEGKFTRETISTLKAIADDFDLRLAQHSLTETEFHAIRLTRKEFLNASEKEIAKVFSAERHGARKEFAGNPEQLAQKLKLIDDEYLTVRQHYKEIKAMTPEERLQKYEALIDLRRAYEGPTTKTLMTKFMPVEDGYGLLKKEKPYTTVGGYVLQAGDSKVIQTYDDLMKKLRLDYLGNKFELTQSKKFIEIVYTTRTTPKMEIPIGATDAWPCTRKGFLANTTGDVLPEYKSALSEVAEGEMYLIDGVTGERNLAAIYDLDFKRFLPTDGVYWTDDIVKMLKGD